MSEAGQSTPRLNELKERWTQDPDSRIYLQLAEEHRRLGQLEEAVTVLTQGLEKRPRDLSGLVALGRCRLELGEDETAAEILEGVVSRDPAHIVANKLLIEAHLQRGDVEAASGRLDIYRLLNDRDPELDHLVYRLERLRHDDETVREAGADESSAETSEILLADLEQEIGASKVASSEADSEAAADELGVVTESQESGADTAEITALDEAATPDAEGETGELPVEQAVHQSTSSDDTADERPMAKSSSIQEPPVAAVLAGTRDADRLEASSEIFSLPPITPSLKLDVLWDETAYRREFHRELREPFPGLTRPSAEEHWRLIVRDGLFVPPGDFQEQVGRTVSAEVAAGDAVVTEETALPEDAASEPTEPPSSVEESAAVAAQEHETPGGEDALAAPETEVLEAIPEEEPSGVETGILGTATLELARLEQEVTAPANSAEVVERPARSISPVVAEAGEEAVVASPGFEMPELPEATTAAASEPEVAPAGTSAPRATASESSFEPPAAGPAEAQELSARVEEREPAATATLGTMNLSQGHIDEAERIFQQVLDRDPHNRAARAGLERLAQRHQHLPLTASDLLADPGVSGTLPEGLTAKKILILRSYLNRLRSAGQQHVR